MLVPGTGLLNIALTMIAPQSFSYYAFASKTTNSIGLDVNVYAPPVTIKGSIQPVSRRLYEQYGLNLQKNYIWAYISRSITDIDRDRSSDKIVFNGQTYQCLSDTRWFAQDGWMAVMCVQVPS